MGRRGGARSSRLRRRPLSSPLRPAAVTLMRGRRWWVPVSNSARCGGLWLGLDLLLYCCHTARGFRGTSPWKLNFKKACLGRGDYLLLMKPTTRKAAVHRGSNPGSSYRLLVIKTPWREGDQVSFEAARTHAHIHVNVSSFATIQTTSATIPAQ